MNEIEELENEKEKGTENRKLEAGRCVLAAVTGTSSQDLIVGDNSDEHIADNNITLRSPKRRRKSTPSFFVDGGLAEFGNALREKELAKITLEQRKLEFEERPHKDMLKERAIDREERENERAENSKNEMERLKAVLGFAITLIQYSGQNPSKL